MESSMLIKLDGAEGRSISILWSEIVTIEQAEPRGASPPKEQCLIHLRNGKRWLVAHSYDHVVSVWQVARTSLRELALADAGSR